MDIEKTKIQKNEDKKSCIVLCVYYRNIDYINSIGSDKWYQQLRRAAVFTQLVI